MSCPLDTAMMALVAVQLRISSILAMVALVALVAMVAVVAVRNRPVAVVAVVRKSGRKSPPN
tara:strand:- start:111 stop:296 length:186 start_codon:yes stop_codon:yes gene_type:complete